MQVISKASNDKESGRVSVLIKQTHTLKCGKKMKLLNILLCM